MIHWVAEPVDAAADARLLGLYKHGARWVPSKPNRSRYLVGRSASSEQTPQVPQPQSPRHSRDTQSLTRHAITRETRSHSHCFHLTLFSSHSVSTLRTTRRSALNVLLMCEVDGVDGHRSRASEVAVLKAIQVRSNWLRKFEISISKQCCGCSAVLCYTVL